MNKIIKYILRLINPLMDLKKFFGNLLNYVRYWHSFLQYKSCSNEVIKIKDLYPILGEDTKVQNFDAQYFYQRIWVAKEIFELKPGLHIDIGSAIDYVSFLTLFTRVIYVDIRPLNVKLDNLVVKSCNILQLPFENNSLESLSCLHVAEYWIR